MGLIRILILTIIVSFCVCETVATEYSDDDDDENYNPDKFVGTWYVIAVGYPTSQIQHSIDCAMWRVIKREKNIFNIVHSHIVNQSQYKEATWRVKINNSEINEIKSFHNNYDRDANTLTLTDYNQPYELMVHNDDTRVMLLLSRTDTITCAFWHKYKVMLQKPGWRLDPINQTNCNRPSTRAHSDYLYGRWNVIGIGHPSDNRPSMAGSCMRLSVIPSKDHVLIIENSSGIGANRKVETWRGLLENDKINEVVSGDSTENRRTLSLLDYDDEYDMVLYDESHKIYWLISHKTAIASELWAKYDTMFTQKNMTSYRIDNKNCP